MSIDELRARLERYPAGRYPVQHATAQFQLGVALLEERRFADAERALADAAETFDPDRLAAERAKALNARGAALRELGRADEAADAFAAAAAAFERAGLALEEGAATFNLGLVVRDVETLRRARELLDPVRVPAQASAAARELGALLLLEDELEGAAAALEDAMALADRAGARAELGAAANALGLVRLAQARPSEAAECFRTAAGAHARSVRPAEHAMAKANLALAYERKGDLPRARLAAQQALGAPGVPEPVEAQARALIDRLPPGEEDLFVVLEGEPHEHWPAVVREEVLRWLDECADVDDAAAFARGLIARPELAVELGEAWLAVLLELPAEAFETVLARSFQPLEPRERTQVRTYADAAAARFHSPQLLRLSAALDRWS